MWSGNNYQTFLKPEYYVLFSEIPHRNITIRRAESEQRWTLAKWRPSTPRRPRMMNRRCLKSTFRIVCRCCFIIWFIRTVNYLHTRIFNWVVNHQWWLTWLSFRRAEPQDTKMWDIFEDPPAKKTTGSADLTRAMDIFLKVAKICTYLIVLFIVLSGAVVSKLSFFFMTSQLTVRNVSYCNDTGMIRSVLLLSK